MLMHVDEGKVVEEGLVVVVVVADRTAGAKAAEEAAELAQVAVVVRL